jgi:DNA-binding XRE family transcriptional regulator
MEPTILVFDPPLTPAQKIRCARLARRLRQCDLSAATGLTPHCISNVERGIETRPSIVERINIVLGLDR